MSRTKQTRRSVSVKGLTYQRLQDYCESQGKPVSGFLEELVFERLGKPTEEDRQKFGVSQETRDKASTAPKRAKEQSHESQEDQTIPDSPTPDKAREGAPRPACKPVIKPVPKSDAKPSRQPVIEPVIKPIPESSRRAREEDPFERSPKRPLSKGSPVEKDDKKPDFDENSPELDGYIPPILQF